MDDLSGAISGFLSQPGAMEQLEAMASQLGLGGGNAHDETREKSMPEGFTPEMMTRVMSALSEVTKNDQVTDFLEALRAILRPENQGKIDRAIRAVHLMRAAKTATRVVEL